MNILVTGATKGIGEVIANNLDGKIYAVGRNIEKLKQYKNYFVCDFSCIIYNYINLVICNVFS